MIPEHYSRDIAQRCGSLIRYLRPIVQQGLPDDLQYHGPLNTTFLLALATPMIVLPIERIFKPADPRATHAADDRDIDPALSREVDEVLGPTRRFGTAPFVVAGRWSYVPGYRPFNLASTWPDDLLQGLGTPHASTDADSALTSRLLRDLRNALAHGGIAYLDATGTQTDSNAAMLAFAGTKLDRKGRLVGLNVLRVSEEDFCTFLLAWSNWLATPRIREALNRMDPLAA